MITEAFIRISGWNVTTPPSFGFYDNFIRDTPIDYQKSEIYKEMTRTHSKYNEARIQQRRKSLLKRREEKRLQMARKLARKREKTPIFF